MVLIALFLATPAYANVPEGHGRGLKGAMAAHGNANPKPSSFVVCHGRDCRIETRVKLIGDEWQRIVNLFPRDSASEERESIRTAIGLLEKMTGRLAGTNGDVAGTGGGAFSQGQMDCEDETMNTGTYLTMLEKDGLLRFHNIIGRAHRGVFFNRWPHRAVQIEEKRSKKVFVVDSWFHDNGQPAEIVEYDVWKDGWWPKQNKQAPRKYVD